MFDTIIEDEKIAKRSKSVTQTYDELISGLQMAFLDKNKIDLYELKKKNVSCNGNGKYTRNYVSMYHLLVRLHLVN